MPETLSDHPTAEELRALSLGRLTEADLARVSAHLGDCPACCRRIDQLAADDPLLARLQQSAAQPGRTRWSPRPSAARRSAPCAGVAGPGACRADRGPEAAPVILPAPGRSGTTTSWPRSGAGAWGWCTRRGTGASTGWRP